MQIKSVSRALLALSVLLAGVGQASATTYTFSTDLGTLGGTGGAALAINASGQFAGWAPIAGNVATRATLWNGTTVTDLGTLGGTCSYGNAINASGQVARWE